MTTATTSHCPTCKSIDLNTCRSDCYNPWHRGVIVHFQREPIGTLGAECRATCGASIDDAPSQLAVDREFVTCPQCQDVTCDRAHAAPTCTDPACYREEHARKADEILPGLGTLVRSGQLDPDQPARSVGAVDDVHWSDRSEVIHGDLDDRAQSWRVAALRAADPSDPATPDRPIRRDAKAVGTVKYFISQGPLQPPIEIEIDGPPPCLFCGTPVTIPSMNGPLVCGSCDLGRNSDGSRWTLEQARERHEHCRAKVAEYRETKEVS